MPSPITPNNKHALELGTRPSCGICKHANWTYELRPGLWTCQRHSHTSKDGSWFLDTQQKTETVENMKDNSVADVLDTVASKLSVKAGQNNAPDYTHYVWCQKLNKILSGWSYPEDARDALREVSSEQPQLGPCRVLTKRYLKQINVDPDNDASWAGDTTQPAAPPAAPPVAPQQPAAPADDVNIPDDTALDEQAFRQKWEGAKGLEALAMQLSKQGK